MDSNGAGDPTTVALLITNGFTFLGLVVTGLFSYFRDKDARRERGEQMAKLNAAAEAAIASERLTVKVAADLKKNTDTTEAVHGLVNGRMSAQLERYAKLARRVADDSGIEADVAEAEIAEQALADHLAKMGR